jgi:hypothetical protein
VKASVSAISGQSVKPLERRKPAPPLLNRHASLKVMRYLYQLKQKESWRSLEQVVFYFSFFKKWLIAHFWAVVCGYYRGN